MIEYLFFLGIAYIVFWLVNWVFGLLASLLFALIRFSMGMYVTKAFILYIFVSLTALLTLASMQMNPSTISGIILPLIGVFIIFTALGQDAYGKKRQAIMERDYELMESLKYDGLFVIGFTVLFIVMLFVPSIAQNILTMRLLALIDWAYELKILGWILRIGGALFLLAIVFQGISLSAILMGSTIARLRRGEGVPKKDLNWFERHLNWTWVLGWLFIPVLSVVGGEIGNWVGSIFWLIISGWVIKQKGRRLWWLLLSWVGSPLWLKNKKRKPEPLNTPYRLEQIPDKKQEEETDKNLEVIKPQYKNSSPETMSMDELDHELEESNRKIEQFFILHPRVLEDMPDSDLLTLKKNHNSNQKFVKLIDDILEARAKAKKEF